MKSDICIVTSYKREEILWLCLEAIRREDPNIDIYVFSDRGYGSPELAKTHRQFLANCVIRDPHYYYGNSYNLIEACQWAVNTQVYPPTVIHLIEEDTIIHPGYFTWARTQLTTGHYAAVCGRIGSPHIPSWYESPCASWNPGYLRIALSHLVPGYFAETREQMGKVLDEEMFPNSQYKKGGFEQDGFFLRCIEHHGWKTKFPPTPLATHLGSWGYNSPFSRQGPTGTFESRIEAMRQLAGDRETRIMLFGHRITEAEMSGWDGTYTKTNSLPL